MDHRITISIAKGEGAENQMNISNYFDLLAPEISLIESQRKFSSKFKLFRKAKFTFADLREAYRVVRSQRRDLQDEQGCEEDNQKKHLGIRDYDIFVGNHILYILSDMYVIPDLDIPYFLRCFLFIHHLKSVLMMKNKWSPIKFSEFTERFILLVGNIWTLLYFGVAAFNYSESEFPGEKRSTIGSSCNTNSNNQLSLMDTFYFICITITTVAPQTIPGQVVIILLIITGITIVPGLVSDMQESLKMQQSGAGSYTPGRNPFIVICGLFNDTTRTIRVVRSILTRDKTENTTVVLLSRENLNTITKYALKKSKYKNRVFHIQGSGLVANDLARAQLKKAKGAIILANLSTNNKRVEDEHNTLRAWAFSDYEPKLPLFVETLLPDTSIFQESITGGSICINEFQQTYLAYNCLYRGVGTLMVNLIQKFRKLADFTEPWQLQYADGLQNEIFVAKVNPIFVGMPFAEVASYLFKEFQIVLFALDIFIPEKQCQHVVLNPGLQYSLKECDKFFFIALQYSDVQAACELTHVQYLRSKVDRSEVPDIDPLSPDVVVPRINSSKSFDEYIKDYPPEAQRAKGNRRSDLLKAGVLTADRIVLMNLSQKSFDEKTVDEDDPFGDTSAIMISNLIHHICTLNGIKKHIITDLSNRNTYCSA
ncbi:hypothetical protein HDV06_002749 [Boothiomyces sp. JEL0866]|nr:hypothetical protein HDV06_002749 [Boothiomyces sp. JEL0866]